MKTTNQIVKLPVKQRILMGITAGTTFAGVLWLSNYFFEVPNFDSTMLIMQGVFFGLFMGIGMPYITQKTANRMISWSDKHIQLPLSANEELLLEGPANLYRGIEAVGGKLFATNQQLVFISHKYNIQRGQTNIAYKDIASITPRKTGNIVDNGLRITTHKDKKYDLAVNERNKWEEVITPFLEA